MWDRAKCGSGRPCACESGSRSPVLTLTGRPGAEAAAQVLGSMHTGTLTREPGDELREHLGELGTVWNSN